MRTCSPTDLAAALAVKYRSGWSSRNSYLSRVFSFSNFCFTVIPDRLLAFFSRTPGAPRGARPRRQPCSFAATSSSMIRATTPLRLRLRAPAQSPCHRGQAAIPVAQALRQTGAWPDGAPATARPAGGWLRMLWCFVFGAPTSSPRMNPVSRVPPHSQKSGQNTAQRAPEMSGMSFRLA